MKMTFWLKAALGIAAMTFGAFGAHAQGAAAAQAQMGPLERSGYIVELQHRPL